MVLQDGDNGNTTASNGTTMDRQQRTHLCDGREVVGMLSAPRSASVLLLLLLRRGGG